MHPRAVDCARKHPRGPPPGPLAGSGSDQHALRLGVEAIDLYQWHPEARFDLIVASLYQMPVDPYEEPSGHRPLDYWGRNLLDKKSRLSTDEISERLVHARASVGPVFFLGGVGG